MHSEAKQRREFFEAFVFLVCRASVRRLTQFLSGIFATFLAGAGDCVSASVVGRRLFSYAPLPVRFLKIPRVQTDAIHLRGQERRGAKR